MLVWAKVRGHFAHDGAWRDILVPGSSSVDWQRFLDIVRTGHWKYEYQVDGKGCVLPDTVTELADDRSRLLTIGVLASGLNCHLWFDGDVELDFIPTELSCQSDLDALSAFCAHLAVEVGKQVLVTHENSPKEAILSFGPDGRAEYVGEGLSHG